MSKYTVIVNGGVAFTSSRKDRAVKFGETTGVSYEVQSPSGAVVHTKIVEAPDVEPVADADYMGDPEDFQGNDDGTVPGDEGFEDRDAELLDHDLTLDRDQHEDSEQVTVDRTYPGNYSIEMIPFVQTLAEPFSSLEVTSQTYPGKLERTAHITGPQEVVEMFVELLDKAVDDAFAALKVWQKDHRDERRTQTDQQKYLANRRVLREFAAELAGAL